MNKDGQTLIAFVIIVPILLLLMAFVIDTGIILKEYTHVTSTTKTILKTTYKNRNNENYEKEVKELFKKNDIPVDYINIEKYNNKIKINIAYDKESIFGQVIGIKSYKIKNTMTLEIKNESDVVITKE